MKKRNLHFKKQEQVLVHYEFGGKFGAIFIMLSLPLLVYLLFSATQNNSHFNAGGGTDEAFQELFKSLTKASHDWTMNMQLRGIGVILIWFAFQSVLAIALPGPIVEGVLTPSGQRLQYKLNGHFAFWVTVVSLLLSCQYLSTVYDVYFELMTASVLISFIASTCLFVASFRGGGARAQLSSNISNSESRLYDFFIGRELNPRLWEFFDLKFLCELRPGLLGWMVLNGGMMCKQYELVGSVSLPMLLVNLCQGFYVWDALHNELAILTTMDITHDGFGWMLVFGDLTWVPFTYGLQARYLVHRNPDLGTWTLAGIFLLNALGYTIFRGSNSEKNNFRRNPNQNPKWRWLTTKSGSKLLISGWWGLARKMNYTGDLVMGLSWCLFCGWESIVPYFYLIYFTILLVHRSQRDDALCLRKYGQDWEKYKELVPYTFLPYIY